MAQVYFESFEQKHSLHKKQAEICETILIYICSKTGFNKSVLKGKCRMIELNYARYSFYKYCKKKHPEISNEIIAKTVNREASTMQNALNKIDVEIDLIQYYKSLKLV